MPLESERPYCVSKLSMMDKSRLEKFTIKKLMRDYPCLKTPDISTCPFRRSSRMCLPSYTTATIIRRMRTNGCHHRFRSHWRERQRYDIASVDQTCKEPPALNPLIHSCEQLQLFPRDVHEMVAGSELVAVEILAHRRCPRPGTACSG